MRSGRGDAQLNKSVETQEQFSRHQLTWSARQPQDIRCLQAIWPNGGGEIDILHLLCEEDMETSLQIWLACPALKSLRDP